VQIVEESGLDYGRTMKREDLLKFLINYAGVTGNSSVVKASGLRPYNGYYSDRQGFFILDVTALRVPKNEFSTALVASSGLLVCVSDTDFTYCADIIKNPIRELKWERISL
jgi:hypothetical protein